MPSPSALAPLRAGTLVKLLEDAGQLLRAHMPDPEQVFSAHTTDSRRLGPQQIFIAYRGVKTDAHQHIAPLLQAHPDAGVIYDDPAFEPQCRQAAWACLVKDSREAWAQLAAYRWGQPQRQLRFLGVTGTNGKTSTVWILRQLLLQLQLPCMSIGTLGVYCGAEKLPASHTTPDPDDLFQYLALAVERGIPWVAMELSSHAVRQKRLGPLRFDGIAFTSFSRDHLDFHPSMEDYFAAKWELVRDFRKQDAPAWLSSSLGSWLPREAAALGCFLYGPEGPDAARFRLSYQIEAMDLGASRFQLQLKGAAGQAPQVWRGSLPFGGDFAVDNFAAAFALMASVLGRTVDSSHWGAVAPVPGRFEPLLAHGLAVLIDYAHTPDALEKTLTKLRALSKGQVWVVFGCGGDRDKGKRPLMGRIAEVGADRVILTSDNPRSENPEAILDDILAGFERPERAMRITDRAQAIQYAIQQAAAQDVILVAGKGHEDYQLIGTQVLSFDDKKVAAAFLASRS